MISSLQIAVTGGSGFIGSHLVAAARSQGHQVVTFSRKDNAEAGPTKSILWTLGDPLPQTALQSFDVAVHLAHDFGGKEGASKTVRGTLMAIDSLRKAGARRQLFFSSLSSRSDATSLYGKIKFEIEQSIAKEPDIMVVRPGLVLGNGGIYGRIRRWIQDWPFAPLPDGGRGEVNVITIEELCRKTLAILMQRTSPREFNLFDPHATSLRNLVRAEAEKAGRHIIIIPIPSQLLLVTLKMAELLNFPLPVKADNLAGFLANQSNLYLPSNLELQ